MVGVINDCILIRKAQPWEVVSEAETLVKLFAQVDSTKRKVTILFLTTMIFHLRSFVMYLLSGDLSRPALLFL
jgi:hypothetical protein